MNITYNNVESPTDMLTFTEVPNILKVEELMTGTKATFTFSFSSGLRQTVTADTQYYITFLGETISNVMDASKAKNKRFFCADDGTSTAASVARAFRNCASLAAEFNIIHSSNQVMMIAKTIGVKWSNTANYLQRNIPQQYMQVNGVDGNAYSDLYNSKIDVDVYSGITNDLENYVTTLEKNFYGDECAFDMSPTLATISDYGKTQKYYLLLKLFKENGDWLPMATVSGTSAVGYHANQSDKYKVMNGTEMLINKNRGINGVMKLYTYSNTIPYSVLCSDNTGGWTINVTAMDSSYNTTWTTSITGHKTSSSNIIDSEAVIPQGILQTSYYIDVTLGNDTTRFNIIKPLKATEYYQRILWRNEYGGISFFDFTGARSESDSVDIDTYEKNIFDYYDNDEFERKMIYSNDYKKTVSLTTHLMEADGRWIFNSLMMSKKVWTVVNGKLYYIIPKSIDVQEDNTYNNIYTAKLTYEYSDI